MDAFLNRLCDVWSVRGAIDAAYGGFVEAAVRGGEEGGGRRREKIVEAVF